jgi:hypothetical protein
MLLPFSFFPFPFFFPFFSFFFASSVVVCSSVSGWPAQPGMYVSLLKAVGEALEEAGLASETLVGPASAVIDFPFLQSIFELEALRYLDAVSVHPYRPEGPEDFLADVQQLKDLIAKHLPRRRAFPPILAGEWGWATCADSGSGAPVACQGGGGSGEAISYAEQASRLVRQRLVNDMAGVRVGIWYDWSDDGPNRALGENNFGTVHNGPGNGSLPKMPKPAFTAAQVAMQMIGDRVFARRLNASLGTAWAVSYADTAGGPETVYAAWLPGGQGNISLVATGRGHHTGCSGHLGTRAAGYEGCLQACLAEPACGSFTTRPLDTCELFSDPCLQPQFSANCGGSCIDAVTFSLGRIPTPAPVTLFGVAAGCYNITRLDGTTLPAPACTFGANAINLTIANDPVFLKAIEKKGQ